MRKDGRAIKTPLRPPPPFLSSLPSFLPIPRFPSSDRVHSYESAFAFRRYRQNSEKTRKEKNTKKKKGRNKQQSNRARGKRSEAQSSSSSAWLPSNFDRCLLPFFLLQCLCGKGLIERSNVDLSFLFLQLQAGSRASGGSGSGIR